MCASQALLDRLVAIEHEKAKLDRDRAKIILQDAQNSLAENGVLKVNLIHQTGLLVDCLQEFEAFDRV